MPKFQTEEVTDIQTMVRDEKGKAVLSILRLTNAAESLLAMDMAKRPFDFEPFSGFNRVVTVTLPSDNAVTVVFETPEAARRFYNMMGTP